MPHWRHIYATAADITMAKTCSYPPSQHALPHCKCVLRWCYNYPRIYLPDQESDSRRSNESSWIHFHIYHWIAWCTVHGRLPQDENKIFRLCFQDPSTVTPEKLYTRKEPVMMETYIADFHTSFYIPEI